MSDDRLYAPAALRNREPIRAVLSRALPSSGLVLELASGTGEHAVFLAEAFPALQFQPTDPDPGARASIEAWRRASGMQNLLSPLALDATAPWPVRHADAVLCINMIHISPWTAAIGLVRGAAAVLPVGGLLYLYGPYKRGGSHTAPSNEAFDASLRGRNPAWGVRELEQVAALAEASGFTGPEIVEMPANNLSLLFRLAADGKRGGP